MSNRTASLHRPDEGRWLAGVAAGVGRRFGVPVWILRVAFVLLCFAGGLGALLYVAGWLLIPGEGETDAIVAGWLGTGQIRRWVGVILVGLAVIILANQTGLIRGDLAFAVVLIGVGVMLYRGDLSRGDHQQDSTPSRAQPGASTSAQAMPSGMESDPPAGTPSPSHAQPGASSSAQAMPSGTADDPPVGAPSPPPVRTPPPPPREASFLGRVSVGFAVLALGVLGLFDSTVPGFHPQLRHYVALLAAVTGVGLVVGAWFGRTRGLTVLGVVLLPILVLSPLQVDERSSIDFDFASVGQAQHRPGTVEEILDEYEMGFGSLLIDLRDVDFAGHTVATRADVGIGEILVRVPEGVSAHVSGRVGMGTLQVGDQKQGGIGVEGDLRLEGTGGKLVLDADIGIGQIVVSSWPEDDHSPYPGSQKPAGRDTYRIRNEADLREAYTLENGSLRLDLGELVLEDDKSVRVDVGRGEVWVTVPRELALRVTSRVDRGSLTLFDERQNGSNLHAEHSLHRIGAPLLTLDISLGEGTMIVAQQR